MFLILIDSLLKCQTSNWLHLKIKIAIQSFDNEFWYNHKITTDVRFILCLP